MKIFTIVTKWTPTALGMLLVYSGIFKLFHPGEITEALKALDLTHSVASTMVGGLTIVELYVGVALVLQLDRHAMLVSATVLFFLFTGFLWYLATLAHPPACGCFGYSRIFQSNRANAVFGVFRNCVILWLLKSSYDYYFPVGLPKELPIDEPGLQRDA
jgi:hypothetical protein